MKTFHALFWSFALLPGPALAAPYSEPVLAMAAKLRDTAVQQNQAYALARALSEDVGPRPAGSPGDAAAVAWALEMLKRQGFAQVRAEPVRVQHWVRGAVRASVLGEDQPMVVAALGRSSGTGPQGLVAPVVRVDSLQALAALPEEKVRDRIVFFDRAMPRTQDGSGYGETVSLRTSGPLEAARRGAAGVLLRSISTSTEQRIAHTGTTRLGAEGPTVPALAIAHADADALNAALTADPELKVSMYVEAGFAEDKDSYNVIGEMPGRSDEWIVLGAHLDSWDLGRGANDDGVGVAIVTEAARLIASTAGKPRRGLRVVLYADEENGGAGGKAYATTHAAELDRVALAMEADFGSGKVWQVKARLAPTQQALVGAIAELLAPWGVAMAADAARGGADVEPLARAGVPLLDLDQDGTRYFDIHHSVADRIENIDAVGLSQAVASYAVAAYLAAEYPEYLERVSDAAH